ncbi:hypothetical protein FOA43_004448 [Brettanomyces nanus]|uniref:Uncharacterized protein n=1 Tax=Eeniella nana TaxID=13502 RepID=A0A875RQI2_EENNA|nr:uncharacterized protein FOA43_004448 [Brettanomyces nanus]QPG77050.1 hypothetical protein FOA43_004448 [Brettanomyces nanus]
MDLSKLSSDLPLPQPIDDDSLDKINRELSNEFKIGARSIAALYRLSNTKSALINAKGYLNCLNDVISLIDNDNVTSLAELKQYLQLKRTELTGKEEKEAEKDPKQAKQHQNQATHQKLANLSIPATDFTLSAKSPFHFPASKLPIGVRPQIKHRIRRHEHEHDMAIQRAEKIRQYNSQILKQQRPLQRVAPRPQPQPSGPASVSESDASIDSEVIEDELSSDDADEDEPMFVTEDQLPKRKLIASDSSSKKPKR